jgi:hypothetical protein
VARMTAMLAAVASHLTARHKTHQTTSNVSGVAACAGEAAAASPDFIEAPRFSLDEFEAARKHLRAEGYAIVAGALSPEEVQTARGLVWDLLEGFGTGIRRDDSGTWAAPRWPETGSTGILGTLGSNHCEAAWFVRGAPGVRTAFSRCAFNFDRSSTFCHRSVAQKPTACVSRRETGKQAGSSVKQISVFNKTNTSLHAAFLLDSFLHSAIRGMCWGRLWRTSDLLCWSHQKPWPPPCNHSIQAICQDKL